MKNEKEDVEKLAEQQKNMQLQYRTSLQNMKTEIHDIATALGVTEEYALALIAQYERITMHQQIIAIHEHLDHIAPIPKTKKSVKR